ncbi:V-type proton ATPase subunit d [Eumeta japonica]|uniref:V-type proton ATPase subunit d n=1 Tax=Eumeta variegata TaxID=151549 RepID=A0A4C1TE26_EUMVA|nr:V-type proton ATPase subunit d [Eumeta japonica]
MPRRLPPGVVHSACHAPSALACAVRPHSEEFFSGFQSHTTHAYGREGVQDRHFLPPPRRKRETKKKRNVSQGWIASPWLFNVFIDSVLYALKEYKCELRMDVLSVKCLLYAEDQAIFTPSLCELPEMGCIFNIDGGYLEGLCRGFKCGILKQADYLNLVQCETLEDLKLHLQGTDYGTFLANEPSPLSVSTIDDKLRSFEQMEAIHVAATPAELYNAVLVDTPLAPFFVDCISEQDLDEMNIEIIRNTLYKAYLEAFYDFCKQIGGTTADVMCEILAFEADRRAIIITINSFGTELSKDDRAKLYPRCGKLNPDGLAALARADDYEQVKAVAEYYAEYSALFEGAGNNVGDKTLEDKFFEHEFLSRALSTVTESRNSVTKVKLNTPHYAYDVARPNVRLTCLYMVRLYEARMDRDEPLQNRTNT